MSSLDKLKKKKETIFTQAKEQTSDFFSIAKESGRVAAVAKNAGSIISDLDTRFEQATKLDKLDITFLFFATALQCLRQYLLTPFQERLNDKDAANKALGEHDEHSDRSHRWYKPSLEEIISNPVPFDAIMGGKDFELGISGINHRASTLGHDPILGWIFGTMNITTSTLTTWDFKSFHVKTGMTASGSARDRISNHADTGSVFHYTKERLFNEGIEGKTAVGAALLKEAAHLRSDVNSKLSLPLPIISTISPDFALKIARYGHLDTANVLNVMKQATISVMINTLVAMIHSLFYDSVKYSSWSMFEVKTRKILSYSNAIASASNVLYVTISTAIGNVDSLRQLDVGGLLVTLYRLVSDYNFQKKIKQEFLAQEWYDIVIGN